MKHILLVDDDPKIQQAIEDYFPTEEFKVISAENPEKFWETLKKTKPDVILLDLNLPRSSGLEILRKIKAENYKSPVIVLTGYGTTDNAIEAMKSGAYEFLTKPFRLEKLSELVNKALNSVHSQILKPPISDTEEKIADDFQIVGKSAEIVEIAKLIGQVATTDASVLIIGESGTGKELVAKAIFRNSARKDKPFLSVNCAALPETLLESELFGHEKGSFTGAYVKKLGKFELANGGTIFLDEIGDLSLLTQSKLLRVLQEQEFERVGGTNTIKVDVRVIAATNKSLVECIKEGKFRVDLFYRLKVVSLYLPPLRERASDIPVLAQHFMHKYSKANGKHIKNISQEAMELLKGYPWPGNVRELENNIHTAVVMSKDDILLPEHFPIHSDSQPKLGIDIEKLQSDYFKMFAEIIEPIFPQLASSMNGFLYQHIEGALEKAIISSALKFTKSNQVKAAQLLGISRNTLRDRMSKYNLF